MRSGHLMSLEYKREMSKIPEIINKSAKPLFDEYGGGECEYLGVYQGKEAYQFVPPEDIDDGYPTIYLLKDDKVDEITGFLSLSILESFED